MILYFGISQSLVLAAAVSVRASLNIFGMID